MSAVSISVTPASRAASSTARVCSRSQRRPKLFVPSPTTETSGPPSPSILVLTPASARRARGRSRQRAGVDDDERLRRPRQRDVDLAQAALAALLGDQGRLDDDDVVELEALRLTRRQDRDGRLVEEVAARLGQRPRR